MAEGPKTPMPARRKARKRALEVLYEADLRELPINQVLVTYLARLSRPLPEHVLYAERLVTGVAEHRDRIDELIGSFSEGWSLERMPTVDRNLARIAIYEMLYGDGIDHPVAITEAVELAKQMSTPDSPRFLNGLLDRIAKHTIR